MNAKERSLAAAEERCLAAEDRARELLNKVIDDHEWEECGFQGNNPSKICPVLKRELVLAIAKILIDGGSVSNASQQQRPEAPS